MANAGVELVNSAEEDADHEVSNEYASDTDAETERPACCATMSSQEELLGTRARIDRTSQVRHCAPLLDGHEGRAEDVDDDLGAAVPASFT